MAQGFKNLLPRNLLSDQSITSLSKKNEQYKRTIQHSTDIATGIWRIFATHSNSLQKIMENSHRSLKSIDNSPLQPYFLSLLGTYQDNCELTQQFSDNIQQYHSELSSSNNSSSANFSSSLLIFHQQVKQYQNAESNALEISKKYWKQLKYLIQNIESYKDSFNEVRLIYNTNQKIKRYSNCEHCYKICKQQESILIQIAKQLTLRKQSIISTFKQLQNQLQQNQKITNIKIYKFSAYISNGLSDSIKQKLEILGKHKIQLQKTKIQPFLNMKLYKRNNITEVPEQQKREKQEKCEKISQTLRQALDQFKDYQAHDHQLRLAAFVKEFQEALDRERNRHKAIMEIHYQFYKLIQKIFITNLKETSTNFQKTKKKIKEMFLQIPVQTLKKTIKFLQQTASLSELFVRKIWKHMQKIDQFQAGRNHSVKIMLQELRNHTQKIFMMSTTSNFHDSEQLKKKYEFLTYLIIGFDQKINNLSQKIKRLYNDIIADLYAGMSEILCASSEARKNQQEEGNNILQIKRKQIDKLKTSIFQQLKKQQADKAISFLCEKDRMNEFIKLKKPAEIQIDEAKTSRESVPHDSTLAQPLISEHNESYLSMAQNHKLDQQVELSPSKKAVIMKKHRQFLANKVSFVQEEQLLKVFSCAMADKIILQGKLYVTTHRLCFSSNFNAGNVFFGRTFIQLPKKDIITFQKRKNGIFFDNSISITTINGQLLFTSFFKRNQAFDLISEITGKHLDDHAYQSDHDEQDDQQLSQKISQSMNNNHTEEDDDDFNEEDADTRYKQIEDKQLFKHPYKQCTSIQLNFEQLNAYKIMKYFVVANRQVTIGRNKYVDFWEYYKKSVLNHKDIQSTLFQPPLAPYLNKSTFKDICPLVFVKKSQSTFPVTANGIPFMPKFAQTYETYRLHLISKHKWMSEAEVTNTGAPYTDCFKLFIRTVCVSDTEGRCKITAYSYLHFIKNTMMRSIIDSKSFEETVIQIQKLYSQYRKYLCNMAASEAKNRRLVAASNKPDEGSVQQCRDDNRDASNSQADNQQLIALQLQNRTLISNYEKSIKHYKIALAVTIALLLLVLVFK